MVKRRRPQPTSNPAVIQQNPEDARYRKIKKLKPDLDATHTTLSTTKPEKRIKKRLAQAALVPAIGSREKRVRQGQKG